MASVDVPVALLGYGTVGSAVNRLLTDSADDIERATGHRLRVVKALVRDAGKERDYPPPGGVLTTDFREIAGRPVDRRRRRGDGRRRSDGDVRARAAAPRQARRLRQQAAVARRGAGALRGRLGGRRAAALRGQRLRGDPGDQGAARVARRHERPPRARDRQRHDQLRAHRDGGGQELRGGARATRRRAGYAEADPTDDVSGADAAAKMAILATVAFNSRVGARRRRRTPASTTIDAARRRRLRASSTW